MKNIQVVDGADNCIFPIYSVSDEDFLALFPDPGQSVEFVQDLAARMGSERAAGELVMRVTKAKADKRTISGIDGTLFIDLPDRRKYFPNKREDDVFVP